VLAAGLTVLLAAGSAGCAFAPTATPGTADGLATLAVQAEGPRTGYSRRAFGPPWTDVDRNGCGTRDDILARDLADVRRRGRCVVVAGVLRDPYSGRTVAFAKSRAEEVQIDHVVSLAEAWRSGAAGWPARRRTAFANDPDVLLATSRAVNAGKGDEDPGTWTPARRDLACAYARRVVAIKTEYGLSVDHRERAALAELLGSCPAPPGGAALSSR
jgi:hypothetical protein